MPIDGGENDDGGGKAPAFRLERFGLSVSGV